MTHDPLQKAFDAIDPTKDMSDAQLRELLPSEALLSRLHESRANPPTGQVLKFRWRKVAIISSSAVLVLAGTAAAITFLRSPVQDVTHIGCFQTVSMHTNVKVIPYSSNPLASCEHAMNWKPVSGSPAPSGSLCVLSDGSLAGFPPSRSPETCARLGLATFNGRLKNPEVIRFEQAAHSYLASHSCASPAAARREMLNLVGRFGLAGWRVQSSGSAATTACASFGIQIHRRIVDIVGIAK